MVTRSLSPPIAPVKHQLKSWRNVSERSVLFLRAPVFNLFLPLRHSLQSFSILQQSLR
jgi:hypothetical protein